MAARGEDLLQETYERIYVPAAFAAGRGYIGPVPAR